ncbi:MAG: hypothetical protein Dbin4_02039, partial [Alphaproteobacteria bacterium]|nr:hypothetical protein [Alphaproteobacteria bacterium]
MYVCTTIMRAKDGCSNVAPAMTNRRVIANNFDVPNPVEGRGYDTGVMLRLLDNRFSARLT